MLLRYLNYLLLLPLHFLRSMETASGDDQTPGGNGGYLPAQGKNLSNKYWHVFLGTKNIWLFCKRGWRIQFHVDHFTINMHSSMN